MSRPTEPADVVIVGYGATGAIAGLQLTRAGKRVVALEAGPWRGVRDFGMDEIANDVRNTMGSVKFNREIPTTRTTRSHRAKPALPGQISPMMNGVGGASVHYTAKSFRYLPWNFEMRSASLRRYGRGALPENSPLEDWPFSYDDLEPYYEKVERLIGVSGQAGNIRGKRLSRGNTFEGPRQRPYPLAPLRTSGYLDLADAAAHRLGWNPHPAPTAINSEAYGGRPGCEYCGFCTNNGCHIDAKGSTSLTAVPEAQVTGNLDLRTGARAIRITVDGAGRANGVDYVVGRELHHQPAKVVILASYLYENVRLLLLSKSRAFPHGLSNNHRQVGSRYISQAMYFAYGLFDQRLNRFGPAGQSSVVDDFDGDNFDHDGLGFIGGGGIHQEMEVKPINAVGTLPPDVPRWGSEWKRWVSAHALSVGKCYAQMDTLPHDDIFLDLDPTHRDPLGLPILRVTYDTKPDTLRRAEFLNRRQLTWLREMGAGTVWSAPAFSPINQHAYGGAPVGTDEASCVLDEWSVSHEVPNLVVLGGAGALSAGGVNPTLTFQAMAWRSAEHLIRRWKDIAGVSST